MNAQHEMILRNFMMCSRKMASTVFVRQEHGTDIDAACGQLRSKQIRKNKEK